MKNILLAGLLFCSCFLAGCFEDESTLATRKIGNIEIEELKDKAVISYCGMLLEASPVVKTDYPESELSYAWYYFGGESEYTNGYREHLVAEEKNLSYEVNLPSGRYTFVFEVTAKNGYTQTETMNVSVSTDFSEGFYILKETANGNTDADVFTERGLSENVLAQVAGASLEGKPTNISMTYIHPYIDEESLEIETANMVNIFTEKEYRTYRSEDLKQIFDCSNAFFGEIAEDEKLYMAASGFFSLYMVSSKGVYSCYGGEMGMGSTGQFGFPVGTGGSKYFQALGSGMDLVFWNDVEHGLNSIDFNGAEVLALEYELKEGMKADRLKCIASGKNYTGSEGTLWFLTEDNETTARYLYIVDDHKAVSIQHLDVSLHIAKGKHIAGNALQAKLIYVVDANHLYVYNWETKTEQEIALPGIATGEEVTYVSNQFLNINSENDDFDCLVVATQQGDKYKCYFYEDLVGGYPMSETNQIAEGEGLVKSVRFMTSRALGTTQFMQDYPLPYGD